MDRMLYLAMNGAKQTLIAQAANTHNLANTSTTGFKADFEAFRAMPVFGPGYPSRVYAMAERPGIDFEPGAIQQTGRDLDLAIHGDGFFAVQSADGSEAYTRAGDLQVAPGGILTNGAGQMLIGNNGPIALPPFEKLEIGIDGTISIRPVGEDPNTLVQVDRIKLVKPALTDLEKGTDGLFRQKSGVNAPADADVHVVSGALESSNVSAVGSLVEMISLQRQYELQVKMMKSAEENDAYATRIMSLGG